MFSSSCFSYSCGYSDPSNSKVKCSHLGEGIESMFTEPHALPCSALAQNGDPDMNGLCHPHQWLEDPVPDEVGFMVALDQEISWHFFPFPSFLDPSPPPPRDDSWTFSPVRHSGVTPGQNKGSCCPFLYRSEKGFGHWGTKLTKSLPGPLRSCTLRDHGSPPPTPLNKRRTPSPGSLYPGPCCVALAGSMSNKLCFCFCFLSSLIVVADVHLAIIVRTTRAGSATALAPKGKISTGVHLRPRWVPPRYF